METTYKNLDKEYKIVPTPRNQGKKPCELCCFSQEECFKIIDDEGYMACGCEFGGWYHCEQI